MLQQIQQYSSYFIVTLTVLLAVSLLLQILLWFKLTKMKKKYALLTRGVDNSNLEDLIFAVNEQLAKTEQKMSSIQTQQKNISDKLKNCIKTPTLIRYNAFDNVGSNLSFSLALIDEQRNGVVLTSLYGRDDSRLYAKSVKSGREQQKLSPEEQEALAAGQSPEL